MESKVQGQGQAQNIRGLLEECHKAQLEIKAHLGNSFDRDIKETAPDASRPNRPNVLDEIMDNLKDLNESQRHTIVFLIEQVNSKL